MLSLYYGNIDLCNLVCFLASLQTSQMFYDQAYLATEAELTS